MSLLLLFNSVETQPPTGDFSSISVVVYDVPRPRLAASSSLYYRAADVEPYSAAEAQPHFVAKFGPVKYTVLKQLRQNEALDITAAVAADSGGDLFAILGDLPRPDLSSVTSLYYRAPDVSFPPVVETNTHFVATFKPAQLRVLQSLFQQPPGFEPPVVETNTHFLATFKPAQLKWFAYNHADIEPPVSSESNPHFVARFKPATTTLLRLLWQNPPEEPFVAPAIVETNTHFIGSFAPVKIRLLQSLWQAADIEPPVSSESNPHFIARFAPVVYDRFSYNHWDVQPPAVETNTHFIAGFTPAKIRWFGYNNWDIEPPVVETNTHFIATFGPVKVKLLQSLWQYAAFDPPQAETQPHFIGKFTPTTYRRFGFNQSEYLPPQSSESNPHFVGRFAQPQIKKLASLWNNAANDIIVTITPQQPAVDFIGKFRQPPLSLLRNLWSNSDHDLPGTIVALPPIGGSQAGISILGSKLSPSLPGSVQR